jgi:hypothetical protein
MKNNLLEINFLKNMIVECNQQIIKLNKEIENNQYSNKNNIKQEIVSFIKKRENAKNKFNNLIVK